MKALNKRNTMMELNNNVATHLYKPAFGNYSRIFGNKSNERISYVSNYNLNATNYLTSNTSVVQPTLQYDFQTLEIEDDLGTLDVYLRLKPKYRFKIKGKIVSVTKKSLKFIQ